MASLIQGRIVWCEVTDPQSRNPKTRPVVILTQKPEDIPTDQSLQGVCVTTQIGQAPREDCVPLPWSPTGNVLTKLKEESEAVCTWLISFTRAQITSSGGLVPPKTLKAIHDKLEEIQNRES